MKKFIKIFFIYLLLFSCSSAKLNNKLVNEYYYGNIETKKNLQDALLNTYEIKKDKFKQLKFYNIRRSNYGIRPYIDNPVIIYGASDISSKTPTYLRLIVRYTGDSWIFFDSITFLYDKNKVYTIDLNDGSNYTNTIFGKVLEKYDYPLNDEEIKKLEEIMKSDKVEYRLSGKYSHDSYIYKKDLISNLGLISLYLNNKK